MRLIRGILCLCATLAWCGCAGYKLGPTNGIVAGAKSVQFLPFANRTLEPRLTDAVAAALRKEAQRDGTYRLETRGTADIVVTGTITVYDRREQTLVPTDVATARDYQLRLTAKVVARDRTTGKVVIDQTVSGYTLTRVGSDFPSAERQALPLLADDLAKRITALLVDGTW